MIHPVGATDDPTQAFEVLGPHYDAFTSADDYSVWGAHIASLAAEHGVSPPARALDLACGTGKSTRELLRHGFAVDACDISPSMLDQARHQPDLQNARFFQADMRCIQSSTTYDLVNCMDDAINFLDSENDLDATFKTVASLLAPQGLFIFDVNTWHTYNTWYSQTEVTMHESTQTGHRTLFVWQGRTGAPFDPGTSAEADLYILDQPNGPTGTWTRSRHRQRHFTPDTISRSLRRAGLASVGAYGLKRTSPLDPATEHQHGKAVYVTRMA